jgi:ElaB/YqjD/DUF883 family membrane-anchored ribosome-binding protein
MVVSRSPVDLGSMYEIKLDGSRVQGRVRVGRAGLLTRHRHDWAHRFPEAATALSRQPNATLDGELAAPIEQGSSDFPALHASTKARSRVEPCSHVSRFLLRANGRGTPRTRLPRDTQGERIVDSDRTDQKRDRETGHWVSDLKPGATTEAKVDKGVEDTFPASDPAPKPAVTGFISPDGEDTARKADDGSKSSEADAEANSGGWGTAEQVRGLATQASATADRVRRSATASVNQRPLAALLIAGAVGWVLGLLANARR